MGVPDREVSDAYDHQRVLLEHGPSYTLRRVWLSNEEETGCWYGFANEGFLAAGAGDIATRGLAPASERLGPSYQRANRKFADAVIAGDGRDGQSGYFWAQDYHFALLPGMVKAQRPDARVAIFWHIPWPNPEAFRICPWQAGIGRRAALRGLLIGFHIQSLCNEFSGDGRRGARVEDGVGPFCRESATSQCDVGAAVSRSGVDVCEKSVLHTANWNHETPRGVQLYSAKLGVEAACSASALTVSIDTKGIIERFRGIEHFLTFIPPTSIAPHVCADWSAEPHGDIRYKYFFAGSGRGGGKDQHAFQAGRWKPIVLLEETSLA